MLNISAAQVQSAATYEELADSIRDALIRGVRSPARVHHQLSAYDEVDATLLIMPSWDLPAYIGVKVATVFPSNAAQGLASVNSQYLLLDGSNGKPLALIDGGELTARRTAAASALAARYLRRRSSQSLLIVGTGTLSTHLALAHACELSTGAAVRIWGRSARKAQLTCDRLKSHGIEAAATTDLASAVSSSDLISVATLSQTPLVRGEWLRPGTHVDLVGGFTPDMRESDDLAIQKATVFCDSAAALSEAGDLMDPIKRGLVTPGQIASLGDLCSRKHPGRTSEEEITLFKSVGFAVEDLASAALIYNRVAGRAPQQDA